MKLRPRSRCLGSQVSKVKKPLIKKSKEKFRAQLNRRPSVEKGRLFKKKSDREPLSIQNYLELDRQCSVAVKRLTLAEIEKIKESLKKRRHTRGNRSGPEKKPKLCLPGPPPPQPSPTGIMKLPEEVLDHIFGFLTFAEVKTARLVNKYWRQIATTPLRRSSKQIFLGRSVFECVTKIGDGQFPVSRLTVRLDEDACDPKQTKRFASYFLEICSWVKELTLQMDINYRSQVDMSAFPRDCIYKELTHFNLQLVRRKEGFFWSKGIADFVWIILEKSPNLREVNVMMYNTWYCPFEEVTNLPVIEDLFSNSNSVVTSKISYMDFEKVPLENLDLAKWSTLNLKLKKLKIALSHSNDINERLAKFLEIQTGNLKELTLSDHHCDSDMATEATFTFPKMEKLDQLGFTRSGNHIVTFPGIDYAKLFPCLKKLDLEKLGIRWSDFLGNTFNPIAPTHTVEELILPHAWAIRERLGALLPDPVITAASLFPAVKKLEIYASPVFTEAVYANMPNLEVLSLNGDCGPLDDTITGLSSKICATFKGNMTNTWIEKLKTAERRSISCLQNLKSLKLRSFTEGGVCVSRLSFHVLERMSSLKFLDVFNGIDVERISLDKETRKLLVDLRARFVVL